MTPNQESSPVTVLLVAMAWGALLGAAFQDGVMMPGIMRDKVEAALNSCIDVPRENFKSCVMLDFD